ncbi:MepB family protein [Flavobacterium sp. HSC-61S13]|uniref:MepB family protein n=1 Tax=Flavobacterium sp. HSC-61S13 TaxID=2910963 RepID=UPI00209CDA75|nr:MepB family protein [Flavobacterium sp. HSC-61S13]MCP1995882.1 hypothetical protein [Flavobacterium sp. HSC-61S13]
MSLPPNAFTYSKTLIYDVLGLTCTIPLLDEESSEYAACSFNINKHEIIFRSAKITPTKIGQFVTLWKRSKSGPIEPFQIDDTFDFLVVCVQHDKRFGQFIFPKSILHQKGILSDSKRDGKRAFRLYPAWDQPTSKQALKTQEWQLNYFYEISEGAPHEKILSEIKEVLL